MPRDSTDWRRWAKVIAVAPTQGLAYSGWRRMPLADDAAARALQVMFVLRELRGDIHLNALTISGIEPIEAHMLNKGHEYATMFGAARAVPRRGGQEGPLRRGRGADQPADRRTVRRRADHRGGQGARPPGGRGPGHDQGNEQLGVTGRLAESARPQCL